VGPAGAAHMVSTSGKLAVKRRALRAAT